MVNNRNLLFVLTVMFFLTSCAPSWLPQVTVTYDKKTKSYGYYDLDSAKWKIDPRFSEAEKFNAKGNALVREGRYWYVIDKNGRKLTDDHYINRYESSRKRVLARDTAWGILDDDGKIWTSSGIISFGNFEGKYSIAANGKKYGVINRNFKLVLPCEYDRISIANFKQTWFIVSKDGKSGILDDRFQTVVPLMYDSVISSGLQSYPFMIRKGRQNGLCNKKGNISWLEGWDKIEALNENLFCAYRDGKITFINNKGEIQDSTEYDECEGELWMKKWYRVYSHHKAGLVDVSGKSVLKTEYDIVGSENYSDMRGMFVKKDNQYRFFDENGKLQEEIYDSIRHLNYDCWENYFAVKRNGKWQLTNKYGKVLCNESWTSFSADPDYSCSSLLMKANGEYFFITKKGQRKAADKDVLDNYSDGRDLFWKPGGN